MRLAYLTSQVLPRETARAQQLVAMVSAFGQQLDRDGDSVELVSRRPLGKSAPTAAELAAHYGVAPSFALRAVRSPWAAGVAGGGRADVLYTADLPILWAGLRLGRGAMVFETHQSWSGHGATLGGRLVRLSRSARFVGAVVDCDAAGRIHAQAGLDGERLFVAHNGHDPQKIEPPLDTLRARARCGLDPNRPTVAYTGDLSPLKGMSVLDLAERRPEVQFALVGSGGAGPVERRAASLDNVHVIPWLAFDDTIPYLYGADVLLIPPVDRPGVLPTKAFHYMACGKPILGPRTEALTEVLEDGRNACLVQPGDLEAADRALAALLDDPKRREAMGAAAREDARQWTWKRRAERILAFIREARRRRHPTSAPPRT